MSNAHDLTGRIALVTGGARGIGAATAKALANAGATLLISDILDGTQTAADLGGTYIHHDVSKEEDWKTVIAHAQSELGGLDILVNNAGIFWTKPIVDTDLEDFRRMQQINVDGVFLGMKHAIPAIAQRAHQWNGGGAIVNISSVAGLIGSPLTTAYSAAKGAVRLMTKSAAMECAVGKLKIRINSVHPGVIETDMAASTLGQPGSNDENDIQARKRMTKAHPMGHFGRAEDIANAVTFLASDTAAFTTGAELVVDGGMTAI